MLDFSIEKDVLALYDESLFSYLYEVFLILFLKYGFGLKFRVPPIL